MSDGVDTLACAVGELVRGPAVVCEPDTPLRTAAERMTEAGQTAIVVPIDERLGIVTDRDLRARVLAGGISIDAPVSAAMSTPVVTAAADRMAGDVLVEMLEHGIHHLPVISADGALIGMIDGNDLLRVEARSPFNLRAMIDHAGSISECRDVAAQLRPTVIALRDTRLEANQVAAIISVVLTALTRRLIDLVVADHGDQPAEFAWLALGSLSRNEALPSSDIDCAIAWDGPNEDADVRSWMRGVATDVVAGLEACGFPRDARNALAYDPLFSRSLEAWREVGRSVIDDPLQEKALIFASVLADARPIWGPDLAAPTSDLFANARSHSIMVRLLARLALQYRPPIGWRGRIVLEGSDAHNGTIDVKRGGLIPIIDLARYAGMAAGTAAGSTRDRLRAAAEAGALDTGDARGLEEAFDLLFRVRLDHQIHQLRTGQAPDNHVDPTQLDPLSRELLKDALQAVRAVQRTISAELDLRLR